MQIWNIGKVKITQIVELTFEGLDTFLPDATPEAVLPIEWLQPDFITPDGVLRFSIHALVIDTGERRIMVDTCVGNHKPREVFPDWHMLNTDFLEDLTAAGYPPDAIDTVLCTHLHLDHVGWNTRLQGNRWIPTFANARYLIDRSEFAYVKDEAEAPEVEQWLRDMNRTVMADSILPIVEADLVELVDCDHRICDEVRLIPTPGHTIGHVSALVASQGESALITGDFVHHPCQLAHPEWSVTTDFDPQRSVATRHETFAQFADTPTLLIGTHWPEPTAGFIRRWGNRYRLKT